jgi:thiamine biosynthesis protein ThiS
MSTELTLQINGRNRTFPGLSAPAALSGLIDELALKGDRIAVELNGEIAPRTQWPSLTVADGDKLEIVHFVGGGTAASLCL